ncbi:MAG: hypothetical protein AVDCRST_MAG19-1894, partial [uncultured Thermomicrobiales bacterium]
WAPCSSTRPCSSGSAPTPFGTRRTPPTRTPPRWRPTIWAVSRRPTASPPRTTPTVSRAGSIPTRWRRRASSTGSPRGGPRILRHGHRCQRRQRCGRLRGGAP